LIVIVCFGLAGSWKLPVTNPVIGVIVNFSLFVFLPVTGTAIERRRTSDGAARRPDVFVSVY
jgi:hypothetical protein